MYESYGDSTQLIFLRARWYNPMDGRFHSRDTWEGNNNLPQSLNRWGYTQSNPINHTDPSGLCVFPLCVFGPANLVVAQAKEVYGKVGPTLLALSQKNPWNNRFNCLDPRWAKPDKTIDLVADYFCERGPDLVAFSGKDALTLELSRSIHFDGEIRQQFYRSKKGSISGEMKFNVPEVLVALLDAINPNTGEISFPLTHFLGSFDYKVTRSSSGRVEYQISNRTDLSSGTHLPTRFPPEKERNNPYSLEKFIEEYPLLASMETSYLIAGNPRIVSILAMQTRSETGFLQGGGTMFQTFTWSERYLGCGFENLPWPVRLTMLDVR
jgi:RHS repeat-associated protein